SSDLTRRRLRRPTSENAARARIPCRRLHELGMREPKVAAFRAAPIQTMGGYRFRVRDPYVQSGNAVVPAMSRGAAVRSPARSRRRYSRACRRIGQACGVVEGRKRHAETSTPEPAMSRSEEASRRVTRFTDTESSGKSRPSDRMTPFE